MLLRSLCLVEALERTIVPLVESPVLDVVDPIQVKLVRYSIPCLNCSLQNRGVTGIEKESVLFQHLTGLDGF